MAKTIRQIESRVNDDVEISVYPDSLDLDSMEVGAVSDNPVDYSWDGGSENEYSESDFPISEHDEMTALHWIIWSIIEQNPDVKIDKRNSRSSNKEPQIQRMEAIMALLVGTPRPHYVKEYPSLETTQQNQTSQPPSYIRYRNSDSYEKDLKAEAMLMKIAQRYHAICLDLEPDKTLGQLVSEVYFGKPIASTEVNEDERDKIRSFSKLFLKHKHRLLTKKSYYPSDPDINFIKLPQVYDRNDTVEKIVKLLSKLGYAKSLK